MRVYLSYPFSYRSEGAFKLKDNFLSEVGVDYSSVPVEVKKKLLSLLENLDKNNYLFLGDIFYDGIDVLEFALFPLEPHSFEEVILPGYVYGKPTFLIRNLFKNSFGKRISVYYDFNFFSDKAIVVNVGYTKSSVSFGGKLLFNLPFGEFHLIDTLGNYLFNRFIGETGVSNATLRKEGLRGEILDLCRSCAARLLFGRTDRVEIPHFNYSRKVPRQEVKLAITPVVGNTRFGEFITNPADFSSSLIMALYTQEELFRERFKASRVVVVGRLRWPFVEALSEIFPVPVDEFSGEEFLSLNPINRRFKLPVRSFSAERSVPRAITFEELPEEVSLRALRRYFNGRDPKGVGVIEKLVEENLTGSELTSFIYELLSVVRRCSPRNTVETAYLNSAIFALSRIEIPESLFGKVERELSEKAFNWNLPFETKLNILYFCHRFKEKLQSSSLSVFPPLMLSYIRERKVTEGEKNFVRTVAEEFFIPSRS